jgi:hypothetical protein
LKIEGACSGGKQFKSRLVKRTYLLKSFSDLIAMSIQVIITEAKGLSNLSGRVKARVAILETTNYTDREIESRDSSSVEEYTNVAFSDANFKL